ncbi:ABC transporter ATP-binding protein [Alphaproteobacteria bacterium]|jgi:ABC-2 type transport system ATP-binding protein|nr:ABC transporter ATP-binding protein [Alphaproteobacteria bacterium]
MTSQNTVIPTAAFTHSPESGLAIEARDVNKIYDAGGRAHHALKSIDIEVPIGCIFGLLGPNGAGKSTFINIMAGTVVKSSGSISIWGTDIDANPRQSRANIGIVPQELNIDAFFTPRETLDMMAGLFGVPKAERHTDEILEMVGLTEQADFYSRRLSGGMRRRLLVGKAMVHRPPILVLDEPTAGVDVALRQRLWDNIKSLNRAGVTVVLTTHYLEEAEALCDRIAIINKGKIIAAKTKADLLASAGQKTLHLSLTTPPPLPLPNALAALGAQWRDGRLSISFDPATSNAVDILHKVRLAGFEVSDISTAEPDLEDVFLSLTK